MDIVVGDIVTGENLFGREEKIREIWDRIQNNSILLASPRRFGKTSLVHEMKRNPKPRWNILYADIEGTETSEDFILKLIEKVDTNFWKKIKSFLVNVKDVTDEVGFLELKIKIRENLKEDWKSKGNKFFEVLNESDNKTIIVLDELPSFLENLEKNHNDNGKSITIFLQWLREIRLTYGIRFILCGSIGIETILEKYNLSKSINDFERIQVPPFDKETAKKMIETLLKRYKIEYTEQQIQRIMDKIGIFVPFFIQLLLRAILDKTNYGKEILTDESIDESYEKGVLGTQGKQYFQSYFTRLKTEYTGKTYDAVIKILDHMSREKESTEEELEKLFYATIDENNKSKFLKIMEQLELGFYVNKSMKYSFHTKVLKDVWMIMRGIE